MVNYPIALDKKVPDIHVWHEKHSTKALHSLLQAPATIVVPLFTRCRAVCPVMLRRLVPEMEQVEKSEKLPVLILSFDEEDVSTELGQFRKSYDIPNDWQIVVMQAQDRHDFFALLDYPLMRNANDFVHRGLIYVLGQDGTVLASLDGSQLQKNDLLEARTFALSYTASPRWTQFQIQYFHLDRVVLYSFSMISVLLVFMGVLLWRQKKNKMSHTGS